MARDCEQLLSNPLDEPPSENSGLDLFLVRSRLKFPRHSDEPADVAAFSCILASTGKQRGARRQFLMLEASLQGVEVCQARAVEPAAFGELAGTLLGRDDDFQVVVLSLDEASIGLDAAQVLLTALQPTNRDTMTLVVAVAANPGAWSELRGVHGFVAAEDGSTVHAAALVFQALASMSAPTLWTCLDAEDILPALGNSESPSQVVEAAWLRNQEQLEVRSEQEMRVLQRASHCAAFLFVDSGDIGATGHIMDAMEDLTPNLHYQARQIVVDFLASPRDPIGVTPVILICRA